MALKKLGERNYTLLSQGAKVTGNYLDAYFYAEEQLYLDEAEDIYEFMRWCNADPENRGWGWGNYEKRFSEFLQWKNSSYELERKAGS